MDFNHDQAIYLQIAEHVCDQIMDKVWADEDKIPSVREFAVLMEVNPNTIMRSYEYLQEQNIIYTKKGMGYFVTLNAAQLIFNIRRTRFIQNELPLLLRKMRALNISIYDLEKFQQQII